MSSIQCEDGEQHGGVPGGDPNYTCVSDCSPCHGSLPTPPRHPCRKIHGNCSCCFNPGNKPVACEQGSPIVDEKCTKRCEKLYKSHPLLARSKFPPCLDSSNGGKKHPSPSSPHGGHGGHGRHGNLGVTRHPSPVPPEAHKDESLAIGLGVGLGLGIPLLSAILWYYLKNRKKSGLGSLGRSGLGRSGIEMARF